MTPPIATSRVVVGRTSKSAESFCASMMEGITTIKAFCAAPNVPDEKSANKTTTTQKRRRDDEDATGPRDHGCSPTATNTTATQSRGGGGGQNLFKRGGAKATKYSELLEQEKPDAKLPTREELRVKTTEQSLEQFDVLVNAWSRQRKVSTNNIAVAIWDKKLKLAKLVKQKGKSLSKFGYSANARMTGGTTQTQTQTQTTTDNGGGTVYLFPEEIAFLVETERVCLFWQARGRGLEPASVKSIHGMLKECGVSMETYVTYAQLCRIGYVARRFGAPWVVPERVKAKARKKRENETYLHRKMAGEGDWVFRGVDNNRTGRCDIDEEKEEKEEEDDDGKMELDDGGTTVATSDNKNDVNVAIEEKVKVDEEETVELQNYPGSRPWFFWSGSKYHPWLGPEIHALCARTQKRMAEERRKRETEKETLRREEEKQELNKISDGGRTWPTFDVWRPNGNFKKSSPGEPDFRIAVCLGRPPHGKEAELLWKRSKNVKLKIANVESGAIMLFDLEAGLAR